MWVRRRAEVERQMRSDEDGENMVRTSVDESIARTSTSVLVAAHHFCTPDSPGPSLCSSSEDSSSPGMKNRLGSNLAEVNRE